MTGTSGPSLDQNDRSVSGQRGPGGYGEGCKPDSSLRSSSGESGLVVPGWCSRWATAIGAGQEWQIVEAADRAMNGMTRCVATEGKWNGF